MQLHPLTYSHCPHFPSLLDGAKQNLIVSIGIRQQLIMVQFYYKRNHAAADLTGQANRLGVTIKADIVKQKLPTNNGGFKAIHFGKTDERMYTELTTDHPIDLCRYQVANGYMGRVGLINSGGESHGASDLKDAVVTAVVNKRAGGMGLISGRKAFQKPMNEGVELLHAIQDVYLDASVTIA